jgi:hypothetical protein
MQFRQHRQHPFLPADLLNMKKTDLLLLFFLLFPFGSSVVEASLYYHLDFEDAEIGPAPNHYLYQYRRANPGDIGTRTLFKAVHTSDYDFNVPSICTQTAFRGNACLSFSWPSGSSVTGDNADKIMYSVAPHYNFAPNDSTFSWNPVSVLTMEGDHRYTGFALYIPPVADMPIRPNCWTILYQVSQVTSLPLRPAFAMHIERNGQRTNEVDLLFVIRDSNDPTSSQHTGDTQNCKQSYTVTIQRGKWYSFVIYQKPSASASAGRLMVYMAGGDNLPLTSSDSALLNSFRIINYYGAWGYAGTTPEFSCQLGLSAAETGMAAKVLFDEIKYTNNYTEARP